MGVTIKQQLLKELEKATPEFLLQLFQFIQFLKQAERQSGLASPKGAHPMQRFIGCLPAKEGDAFAASLEKEFSQIEGEW